jgi:exonuclease III
VIPAVSQAGRLGSADVIVSTINVNGVRAAIKQRSSENLGLLPYALRWSDHAPVTVEYRG